MNKIGHIIKELRREMDCTQNKLADVLGVTQDSISLWENDKRIPDTQYIVAMAKFFDVTTDYLLKDDLFFFDSINDNKKKTKFKIIYYIMYILLLVSMILLWRK